MNKKVVLFTVSFMIIVALLLVSCGPAEEEEEVASIWSVRDWEITKVLLKNPDAVVTMQERTYQMRPPFYGGTMPLIIECAIQSHGAILEPITYKWSFDGFETYFVYHDSALKSSGIAGGAATFYHTDLVAEARFCGFIRYENGQLKGIEIEEFHYGPDGELVFKCKSQIDIGGFKINQTEEIGKKIRDYYFVWPMGR